MMPPWIAAMINEDQRVLASQRVEVELRLAGRETIATLKSKTPFLPKMRNGIRSSPNAT
jgi:hypothetical protein